MGQNWQKIVVPIGLAVTLSCCIQKKEVCQQIPPLAPAYSHRAITGGPIQFDLSNTKGWERHITYTSIANLDSGKWEDTFLDVKVDTARAEYPSNVQLDTLKERSDKLYASDEPQIRHYESVLYCDESGNRFLIIEILIRVDESKVMYREVQAYCIRGQYIVAFTGASTIPESSGKLPPEIRSRFLRWIPTVRLAESSN